VFIFITEWNQTLILDCCKSLVFPKFQTNKNIIIYIFIPTFIHIFLCASRTSLPAGIEILILKHLHNEHNRMLDFLNLRKVCKTTKSWVDNLPPDLGRDAFSNLVVKLEVNRHPYDQQSYVKIEEFMKSAPPFGVSSLSLIVDEISQTSSEETAAATKAWEAFGNYWAPKLRVFAFEWEPRSISREEKNSMTFTRECLYSFLERCTNLRSCDFTTAYLEDLYYVRKFLERWRTCEDLHVYIVITERKAFNSYWKLQTSLKTHADVHKLVELAYHTKSKVTVAIFFKSFIPHVIKYGERGLL